MLTQFVQNCAPTGKLSLVCGLPCSGKSTFLAWLAGHHKSVAWFAPYWPGWKCYLLGLLEVNGVNLDNARLCGLNPFLMPDGKRNVLRVLEKTRHDLVVVDSFAASFGAERSTFNQRHVLQVLQDWQSIATSTGAAVIGSHAVSRSGKPGPAGSMAFQTVPDNIFQLGFDFGQGATRTVRWFKSAANICPPEVSFTLRRENSDGPPRFVPGLDAVA